MKFLLDTHIFLWYISGNKRLSPNAQATIRDTDNEIYLSVVSLWEITVKYQLGKLPLPHSPETYIPKQRSRHLISTLSLSENSVKWLITLPNHHRDPFDRMLICQALAHDLTIMTVDKAVLQYDVPVFELT